MLSRFASHSRISSSSINRFLPSAFSNTRLITNMSANEHTDRNKLFDVSPITAVVTGGGSGIGLFITQALVQNGAKVYITGRREEALKAVVDKYNTGPGSIHSIQGDISDKSEVLRLAKEISSKEPNGIQLLVNNAGVARDQSTQFSKNPPPKDMSDASAVSAHFLKSEPESWDETFRINVTGSFFMSMAFLPLLDQGSKKLAAHGFTSSIINVSSISGAMKGSSGGQFSYAASKAATDHLVKLLAAKFSRWYIRVNSINPGCE